MSDYNETVDRIINASKRIPLSIIVIGIGNKDFKKMKDIDCDDKLLTSACGTRQAVRGESFYLQVSSASTVFRSIRLVFTTSVTTQTHV